MNCEDVPPLAMACVKCQKSLAQAIPVPTAMNLIKTPVVALHGYWDEGLVYRPVEN
jgi:hypothetical protein